MVLVRKVARHDTTTLKVHARAGFLIKPHKIIRGLPKTPLIETPYRCIRVRLMKLRNIPLELDTFLDGEEAERILKIDSIERTTARLSGSDDEPSSSGVPANDEFL